MSTSHPEGVTTAGRLSDLRAQVTALRNRRRSGSDFGAWKPDPFYYLFALLGAALPGALIWRLWGIPVSGCVFVLLCYLPELATYFRFHFWVRLPNRRLQRRIDSLDAEIDRLSQKAGA